MKSTLRPNVSKVTQAAVRRLVERRTKPQRRRAKVVVPSVLRSDSANFWTFVDAFVRNEREPREGTLQMARKVLEAVLVYGNKAVMYFNKRWGTSPFKTFRRTFGSGLSVEKLTDGDVETLIRLKQRYDEAVDYHSAQLRPDECFESQNGSCFNFG